MPLSDARNNAKGLVCFLTSVTSRVKGGRKDLIEHGSEQQEELRYQVTYHAYLASGGRLSYTPSIERVVG